MRAISLLATPCTPGYAFPRMTAISALVEGTTSFPPPPAPPSPATERTPFAFIGERLWLDFVNSDTARSLDALKDFETLTVWLQAATLLDTERALGMRRRAREQPTGAAAALVDARRVRTALRSLAERGAGMNLGEQVRYEALGEINRVLGRSAGTRRVERRGDGTYARAFVPVGDAFAGLMIPIVESAADALILGELPRVRRCADIRCARVFYDGTKNGRRRWCDMATCGNRAKAARHRQKLRAPAD
jgi:predicted RNA-binding Zn ribbon-like protein